MNRPIAFQIQQVLVTTHDVGCPRSEGTSQHGVILGVLSDDGRNRSRQDNTSQPQVAGDQFLGSHPTSVQPQRKLLASKDTRQFFNQSWGGVQGDATGFSSGQQTVRNARPEEGGHQGAGVCHDSHRGRLALRYAWSSCAISRIGMGRSLTRVAIDDTRGDSTFLMITTPPPVRTATLSAGLNKCFGSRIMRLAGTASVFMTSPSFRYDRNRFFNRLLAVRTVGLLHEFTVVR